MRLFRLIPLLLALGLLGCSTSGPRSAAPSVTTSAGSPASSATERSGTDPTGQTSGAPSPSASAADAGCLNRALARLSPQQRAGQLVMVGLQNGSPVSTVTELIAGEHIGNVLFLGGWTGTSTVAAASAQLQAAATGPATGGVKLLIAADQEGGKIWQLRDPDVPRLPSAVRQGQATPPQRHGYGATLAALLVRNGVNLNLAPVADTVPASVGRANEPIGKHDRQYAAEPAPAAAAVGDLVRGMRSGGMATTLKHFPGLGRVTGNTDFTAEGIDDTVATRRDPHLLPFRAGIQAGADAVMMSSARYPRIDPQHQALYSRTLITEVLRGDLKFTGVVLTDDLNARALSGVPAATRATRFIAAGGDIALTGAADDARVMVRAIADQAERDPAFARQVQASVQRVMALKARYGLITCG